MKKNLNVKGYTINAKIFEAFVYFVEKVDPKTAKEFAEKVTGIKAPKGKIKIPKTQSEFKLPKAKEMLSMLSDNVSVTIHSDTKYNADVLATEENIIEDDGIQDT